MAKSGFTWVSYEDRKAIEKLYNKNESVRSIAAQIGKSYVTVYAELKRGYTGKDNEFGRKDYSAKTAQMRLFQKMSELHEGEKKCEEG